MKNTLLFLVPVLLLAGFIFMNAISTHTVNPIDQSKRLVDEKPPGGRRVVKTDAEWKKILTGDQFAVLREHGTERAFTSPLNDIHDHGVFFLRSLSEPAVLFGYEI